jgi:DnaJ-class molecular chaperone
MKNYFKECTTIDQAKNIFRKLSFELHPDYNQSETAHQDFINMRAQYENFKPSEADKLYNTVKKFEGLKGVLISFVGSFIWLEDEDGSEGATKSQKEDIKKIIIDGYNLARFAFNRKKWYYSPEGYRQKFKSSKSFEELKSTWGNKTYKAGEAKTSPKLAY